MDSEKSTELMPIDPEALAEFRDAMQRIAAALIELRDRLAQALRPVIEALSRFVREFMKNALRTIATGKEWHIYTHAKKHRIREKYRKRLTRRLFEALREAAAE